MNTPIYDFVQSYCKKNPARFHMPGHKGKSFLGCEPLDITEISGADSLYEASGIIAESEKNATNLFGSAQTYYSTEGSSHCIRAMLYLALMNAQGTKPIVVAPRNVHKSFISACALLDIDIQWIYGPAQSSICSLEVSEEAVLEALSQLKEKPIGIFVTSPDYLGHQADIAFIAALARGQGIPLLVDNAHGAYLKFLIPSQHPLDLGADLCCDSAHKTLPVLTGGAYLHISNHAPVSFVKGAKSALSLFGSTSPSYLILQSLDLCNVYLQQKFPTELAECVNQVQLLKASLKKIGFSILESEPLKLVLDTKELDAQHLAEYLSQQEIGFEFQDISTIVFMFTPQNTKEDFCKLQRALENFPRQKDTKQDFCWNFHPEKVMTVRQAIFSRQERIPVAEASGRVCASPLVSCPPAIPIVVSGERIPREAIPVFQLYGITHIDVVAE